MGQTESGPKSGQTDHQTAEGGQLAKPLQEVTESPTNGRLGNHQHQHHQPGHQLTAQTEPSNIKTDKNTPGKSDIQNVRNKTRALGSKHAKQSKAAKSPLSFDSGRRGPKHHAIARKGKGSSNPEHIGKNKRGQVSGNEKGRQKDDNSSHDVHGNDSHHDKQHENSKSGRKVLEKSTSYPEISRINSRFGFRSSAQFVPSVAINDFPGTKNSGQSFDLENLSQNFADGWKSTSTPRIKSKGDTGDQLGRRYTADVSPGNGGENDTEDKTVQGQRYTYYHKKDIADKWMNVISEFENTRVGEAQIGNTQGNVNTKEVRKVGSESKNLEQHYENVRQVFTQSMPLPMQMAPPGARVGDIEADNSKFSGGSNYSWNVRTPMGKLNGEKSKKVKSSSSKKLHRSQSDTEVVERNSTRAQSQGNPLFIKDQNKEPKITKKGRDPRQMFKTDKSGARSRSASRSGSRSQSASGSRSQSQERPTGALKSSKYQLIPKTPSGSGKHGDLIQETFVKETRRVVKAKGQESEDKGKTAKHLHQKKAHKGVKFRRGTNIEDQAAIVVDDVINSALKLLYGQRRKTSSSSSSRISTNHHLQQEQLHNQSMGASFKKHSEQRQRVEHVVERHIDHRRLLRSDSWKDKRGFRSADHIRAISSQQHYDQHKAERQHSLRPVALTSKPMGHPQALSGPGMYDMVIQPLGEEPPVSDAELEWYKKLREGSQRSGGDDESNSTTSIKISHRGKDNAYYEKGIISDSNVKNYDVRTAAPPTISRGTVTRVFHDLESACRGTPPVAVSLASVQKHAYQSSQPTSYPHSGDFVSSEDCSTRTWPLNRALALQHLDQGLLSSSSSQFNTLTTGATQNEMLTSSDHWMSHYDTFPTQSGPHSMTVRNISPSSGVYLPSPPHQLSSSPTGNMYTVTNFRSAGRPPPLHGSVDLLLDTKPLIQSQQPLRMPSYQVRSSDERVSDVSQSLNLPAIEEEHSGTYSNEPIIVADLLDKSERQSVDAYQLQQQPSSGSFYSSDDNATRVNMNKNQQLNFYLFNQQPRTQRGPKVTYAAQNIQAQFGSESQRMTNCFFDEEEMHQIVSKSRSDDYYLPHQKEYTIYHKQTQTRPAPKKLESRKEELKKIFHKHKKSPEPPKSPVIHRETHHYITKEREIEKLPPSPPPKSEFCVQTDLTGNEWEDEMDNLYKALNNAERRAYEAERTVEELATAEEERIQNEPEPKEEESEEEFYEWEEIEEKEQKLSMAIFEEIEFNLQRTQGGNTTTESGKTAELVPWTIPDKYEAVVDRRKQKITQLKDIDREGDGLVYQAGFIPDDVKKERPKPEVKFDPENEAFEPGGITEIRDMKLNKETISPPRSPKRETKYKLVSHHQDELDADEDIIDILQKSRRQIPGSPRSKRNYMSTFDHEMNRAATPRRARGRSTFRSEYHIPLAAERANKSFNDVLEKSHSPDRGTKITTKQGSPHFKTVYKSVTKGGQEDKPKGTYSADVLREAIKVGAKPFSTLEEETAPRNPFANQRLFSKKIISQSDGYDVDGETETHYGSVVKKDNLKSFDIPINKTNTKSSKAIAQPFHKKLSPNKSKNSSKYVSSFAPENIYFKAPEWTASDQEEAIRSHSEFVQLIREDSLSGSLPMVEAEHMKRGSVVTKSENKQLPPKFHSKVVKDEHGNLVRVTTTEQQMTKTVDYVSEPEETYKSFHGQRSDEAFAEDSFLEVDLKKENVHDLGAFALGHDRLDEKASGKVMIGSAYGPEVVSETSKAYKEIEYDDQERSLGVGPEGGHDLPESRFLYDMKTATLKPTTIKDHQSGENLMQYDFGDTMITEL